MEREARYNIFGSIIGRVEGGGVQCAAVIHFISARALYAVLVSSVRTFRTGEQTAGYAISRKQA